MLYLFFLPFIIQTADPWFGGTVAGKSPSTPLDAFTVGKQAVTFVEPRHSQKVTLVYSGTQEGIITKPAGECDEYLELRERQRQCLRHCQASAAEVQGGAGRESNFRLGPAKIWQCLSLWSAISFLLMEWRTNCFQRPPLWPVFFFIPQLHFSRRFLRAENVSSGIKWSRSDLSSSSPPLQAPSFILTFSLRMFIRLIPIFTLFSPTNFARPFLIFFLLWR